MVFRTLKGLFGSSPEDPPTVEPGPFGLTLNRAVTMDLLGLRLEEKKLALPFPSETLVISGYGVVQLDSQSVLHRFYDDQHTMLQILCEGGIGDECIREIMLFRPWDTVSPGSAAEWSLWDSPSGKIGAAHYFADGFTFERVWGEPSTPWIQPSEFTEKVHTDDDDVRHIHQKVMPYKREIGSLRENLILAVERDLASADRGSVTLMIGYGLSPADIKPV
jgi:hypothetical protein